MYQDVRNHKPTLGFPRCSGVCHNLAQAIGRWKLIAPAATIYRVDVMILLAH